MNLPRAIEQYGFSTLQGCSNGCQADLQIRQALNDLCNVLIVDHGPQQLALADELLIVLDQEP